MRYIKQGTSKEFALPRTFKLDDGSTITNFDKLTDAERISLAGVFPVVEAQTLDAWQSKSLPMYAFSATEATVTYTLVGQPLADYKKQAIQKVYQASKQEMDAQTLGYSQAEVATWPAIQADVIAYNATTAIGAALQQAADTSAYTVAEVAAIITPKIAVQVAALTKRATLVTSINAAADHAAVSLIGW